MAIAKGKLMGIIVSLAIGASLTLSTSLAYSAKTTEAQVSLEDIKRFSKALNKIKNYYVEPIDDEELFDAAIRGMLSNLDPHSDYLDEDEFDNLQAATRGQFGGLGLEVTLENEIVKVVSAIDNTPAQKAGIRSGDYIIRIDNVPVQGMTLREAVKKMRGQKGTSINLVLLRKGEEDPITLSVTRDVIRIESVKSKILDEKYGYIRVSHFQASTAKNVIKAINDLKEQTKGELEGLILDLRNNPGGLLNSAIHVSDVFIHNDQVGEEELIVYTEGRITNDKFIAAASPGDILEGAPMVVLINQGSASGAEIVAGALRDNHRAIIAGKKSFGKGSVQTVIPLDEHHGIKLTTALYYTPAGKSIQAKGIIPDIIIEDLDIIKNENADISDLQEADLSGHILNGNVKSDETSGNDNGNPLAYTDYQLYEALNILKTSVLSQR
ncbi:MAG: S41 family peptidase [Gammaproteobacteria bacterium]